VLAHTHNTHEHAHAHTCSPLFLPSCSHKLPHQLNYGSCCLRCNSQSKYMQGRDGGRQGGSLRESTRVHARQLESQRARAGESTRVSVSEYVRVCLAHFNFYFENLARMRSYSANVSCVTLGATACCAASKSHCLVRICVSWEVRANISTSI